MRRPFDDADSLFPRVEDQGIFEVSADFFTLLAIVSIFAVIVYGSTLVGTDPEDVTTALGERIPNDARGVAPFEPTTLVVALTPDGEAAIRVRILSPSQVDETSLQFEPEQLPDEMVDWVVDYVSRQSGFSTVVCVLDRRAVLPNVAYRAFFELIQRLQNETGLKIQTAVE